MPAAARIFDATSHPGRIIGGTLTVLIGGRPAARAGDSHLCLLPPNAGPHPTTKLAKGSRSVFIGGRPAARLGDKAACGATIVQGLRTVLIGG